MKVKMGQFELDTDEMASYPTGIPSMPVIYVNLTGAAFAQTVRHHWPAPKVRHLGRAEALRLAECCNIPELKQRLLNRGAPDAVAPCLA
jgi:hypothetical protein